MNQVFFAAQQGAPGQGNIFLTFLPFLALILLMYFFMIRPQKNKEKRMREQLSRLEVGDKIVTIGGIVGRIVNINNDEISISTGVTNTVMTFKKSAVAQVQKANQSSVPTSAAKAASSKAKEDGEEKGFFSRFKKKDVE